MRVAAHRLLHLQRQPVHAPAHVEIKFAEKARVGYPGFDAARFGDRYRYGAGAAMISVPSGVGVWLAAGTLSFGAASLGRSALRQR